MRMKPYLGLTLAILFVCATYPVLAQTAPTATKYNPQFAIGAGLAFIDLRAFGVNAEHNSFARCRDSVGKRRLGGGRARERTQQQ